MDEDIMLKQFKELLPKLCKIDSQITKYFINLISNYVNSDHHFIEELIDTGYDHSYHPSEIKCPINMSNYNTIGELVNSMLTGNTTPTYESGHGLMCENVDDEIFDKVCSQIMIEFENIHSYDKDDDYYCASSELVCEINLDYLEWLNEQSISCLVVHNSFWNTNSSFHKIINLLNNTIDTHNLFLTFPNNESVYTFAGDNSNQFLKAMYDWYSFQDKDLNFVISVRIKGTNGELTKVGNFGIIKGELLELSSEEIKSSWDTSEPLIYLDSEDLNYELNKKPILQ